jgi:hypothetical protein
MAAVNQFERALNQLFARRTAWLHKAVGRKRPGTLPVFSKAKVQPRIAALARSARDILLKKRARSEFKEVVAGRRSWQVRRKGFGFRAKRAKFKRWYEDQIGKQNCIYIFWSGRRCVYVGKTIRGKGRPAGHFEKIWFPCVTRIDIYPVRRRSQVPMAECLAIDMFDPRENRNRAAKVRYSKRCPVCAAVKDIERELRSLFRFR